MPHASKNQHATIDLLFVTNLHPTKTHTVNTDLTVKAFWILVR